MKKDFRGCFWHKIRVLRLLIFQKISTYYSYIKMYLLGIDRGQKCTFYGVPILRRYYNSKIAIGNHCTFRSDKSSNLVGVNRKCIIATFSEGAKISIGDNSGFSGTVIGAANSIKIGNNVLVGANVLITDFDWHPIDPKNRHTNIGVKNAPVVIDDNVWLGINSVVLKGVHIGKNTVIGANSVVVKSIPENVIAAGNPCKVIKRL